MVSITSLGNDQFLPAPPVSRAVTVVRPSKRAWRDLRRGDVRYDVLRQRFARRMAASKGLALAEAAAVFDEDYADSDGDGLSNLFERAIGADSLGRDDWRHLPFRPRGSDGRQRISFIRHKNPMSTAGEDFRYNVERSDDLRSWSTSGVELERLVDLGGGMERATYVALDGPSGGRRTRQATNNSKTFLRLRITLP